MVTFDYIVFGKSSLWQFTFVKLSEKHRFCQRSIFPLFYFAVKMVNTSEVITVIFKIVLLARVASAVIAGRCSRRWGVRVRMFNVRQAREELRKILRLIPTRTIGRLYARGAFLNNETAIADAVSVIEERGAAHLHVARGLVRAYARRNANAGASVNIRPSVIMDRQYAGPAYVDNIASPDPEPIVVDDDSDNDVIIVGPVINRPAAPVGFNGHNHNAVIACGSSDSGVGDEPASQPWNRGAPLSPDRPRILHMGVPVSPEPMVNLVAINNEDARDNYEDEAPSMTVDDENDDDADDEASDVDDDDNDDHDVDDADTNNEAANGPVGTSYEDMNEVGTSTASTFIVDPPRTTSNSKCFI